MPDTGGRRRRPRVRLSDAPSSERLTGTWRAELRMTFCDLGPNEARACAFAQRSTDTRVLVLQHDANGVVTGHIGRGDALYADLNVPVSGTARGGTLHLAGERASATPSCPLRKEWQSTTDPRSISGTHDGADCRMYGPIRILVRCDRLASHPVGDHDVLSKARSRDKRRHNPASEPTHGTS